MAFYVDEKQFKKGRIISYDAIFPKFENYMKIVFCRRIPGCTGFYEIVENNQQKLVLQNRFLNVV